METSNWDETPGVAESVSAEQARPSLSVGDVRARLEDINERIKSFIRERPAACLFGALAAGYLVARAARWGR